MNLYYCPILAHLFRRVRYDDEALRCRTILQQARLVSRFDIAIGVLASIICRAQLPGGGEGEIVPVQRNIYMIARAGANITVQVGEEGGSGLTTQSSSFSYWTSADVGATFGAGVRWRSGRIALKPEVRYTYWGAHPSIGLSKHQADVLLGITF